MHMRPVRHRKAVLLNSKIKGDDGRGHTHTHDGEKLSESEAVWDVSQCLRVSGSSGANRKYRAEGQKGSRSCGASSTTAGDHSRTYLRYLVAPFSSATPKGTRSGDVTETTGLDKIWLDSPGYTPITVLLFHQNDVRDAHVRVQNLLRGAAAV